MMPVSRATVAIERRTLPATGAAVRGTWNQRVAAIVTLDGTWRGEAAPLPGFGTDTVEAAEAALWRWIDDRALDAVASPSARFAIETALAARAAAQHGRSLAAQWAWPDAPHPVATAAVVDDLAAGRAALAAGHVALKIKLTGDGDRARLSAFRTAWPAVALRGDANQRWPLAEVDDRLAELVELGLEYVEEPAPGLTYDAPRAVPLALDESLGGADDAWLEQALAGGALAAIVCKPTVLGGVARCRALARRAAVHGVDAVWSHALEGPVGFAAVVAMAHALGGRRAAGIAPHEALTADPLRVGDA